MEQCHADESSFEDSDEKPDMMPADDVGVQAASMLLGEIEQGGVVDSAHQVSICVVKCVTRLSLLSC